ncbi:hypothetical protein [Candidatus Sororendozoicomonas aggregata]|uniref:hypothetical protein n=1 Tax=Candidatus Sororendozoicomonas aggregata TaxID=3073239 RepID=UPI002ED61E63
MGIKLILPVRKFIVKKSFVFFTGVLSLSVMSNAYSRNSFIFIKDTISRGQPHYSKKGYTLQASGHGVCMLGVYGPPKCIVTKGDDFCFVRLHYDSALGCSLTESTQDFHVRNNDTGKIEGMFSWTKPTAANPKIDMLKNPDNFMIDITGHQVEPNVLNIKCSKKIRGNVE